MVTTLVDAIEADDIAAWRGFAPGSWQSRVNVREFIQRNYTPYEGDGAFLQGADRAHARHVEDAAAAARRGAREGHPRRVAGAVQHPRARARLHRQGRTRSSSACRPTRRSSARSCRSAAGAWSRRASKSYGYKPDPRVGEIFTKYRKTHNDGVFDAYTPDIRKARVVGHRHRPAGRLRPRPHHRRLPPGGALRRRLPHRRQGAREGASSTTAIRPRT